LHVYLTARHLELDDLTRSYVERHLVQPAESHSSVKVMHMEIQLYRDAERGHRWGCHVLLRASGHQEMNIREIDDDLFAAIDLAAGRLLRTLTELKDRRLTLSRHPKKYSFERLARALGWGRSRPSAT
jgi:ribosomal subunit interface protein